MYRKIVVGYKNDEHGEEALALARGLSQAGALEVVVVNVLEIFGYAWSVYESFAEQLQEEGEQRLTRAAEGWPSRVAVSTRVVVSGTAAGSLQDIAEREGADLLVVGSTHRGRLGQALMGTTGEQLLQGAPCPVVLAPHGYRGSPQGVRTVGVGFDGSREAWQALGWAADAARALSAKLRLVSVIEPPPPPGSPEWGFSWPAADVGDRGEMLAKARDGARGTLDDALATLDAVDGETSVLDGSPAHELRHAAEDVDLLVLGSRGFGPVKRVLLGSVSTVLARTCPSPLLVVPRAAEAEAPPTDRLAAASGAG
jgi:nucleotide-binding universal stress UspA family protein